VLATGAPIFPNVLIDTLRGQARLAIAWCSH
jgi:hypothetical protein